MSTSIKRSKNKRSDIPKCIRRVRKKIGDVIEIPTYKGFAYVQYTHEHTGPGTKWGSVIRVLNGFYNVRPFIDEIHKIVGEPHRFITFCQVHYSVNIGDWDRVANFAVPDFAKDFPIFKGTNSSPKSLLEEVVWWLWDGEKEWRVGKLRLEEQLKYPFHSSCNDTALISKIETGKSYRGNLC